MDQLNAQNPQLTKQFALPNISEIDQAIGGTYIPHTQKITFVDESIEYFSNTEIKRREAKQQVTSGKKKKTIEQKPFTIFTDKDLKRTYRQRKQSQKPAMYCSDIHTNPKNNNCSYLNEWTILSTDNFAPSGKEHVYLV